MSRIVIYTFGSLGDLNPYLSIGLELKELGFDVIIATSDIYKDTVEKTGLSFHFVRPLFSDYINNEEIAKKAMDLKRGGEFIIKEVIYGHIEESYEDLISIASTADLLITHSICYAGPIVAEKLKMPWISCALSPNIYLSSYDPPVFPISPVFQHLPQLGRGANKLFINITKQVVKSWGKPVDTFRKQLKLPKGRDPVFEQLHSPYLTLSLFSSVIAKKQPDWPQNNIITGFCFYDNSSVNLALESFLNEGEQPILFTLGTAAVQTAEDFYEICFEALKGINTRAVILKGNNNVNIPSDLDSNVYVSDYIPFNQAFGKCSVIVNQGGIGTVAQVMRAGKPMIGVPFSHDQPDNVFRVKRLGMGEVIYRENLTVKNLQQQLLLLLKNPNYTLAAKQVAGEINGENGTVKACHEICSFFQKL